MSRTAFFVSDSTGLTAERLGNSLLSQFKTLDFQKQTVAYIDTEAKAQRLVDRINRAAERDGAAPIIIDTVIDAEIRAIIKSSQGFTIDVFEEFLKSLQHELGSDPSNQVGHASITTQDTQYSSRIAAVHYALDADDGAKLNNYENADLILIGVSRSGKTPSCLYLGLQYGIYAANYPITEDDLDSGQLPQVLRKQRRKLFALTIDPERLSSIRQERRANSRYASLIQCEDELRQAEMLFDRYKIPVINTTHFSVEEIAAKILTETQLERRI